MEKYYYYILLFSLIFVTNCTYAQKWPKVYDTKKEIWLSMDDVEEVMAQHRVVFVGEKHGHRWGHRIEKMLLESFWNVHGNVAVGLEMFERDIQNLLDGYLDGQVSENFFLQHSRPWRNYTTDYRPLVEFAKETRTPVLALNVPRRYASFVAKNKEEILFAMPMEEQTFMAQHISAPKDRYLEKFSEAMGGLPMESIEPYYRAQCFKDDTMAKSLAVFLTRNPQTKIISYMGSFHSDEGLGTVQRFNEFAPHITPLIITIIPVTSDNIENANEYKNVADLVFFAPENPVADKPQSNFSHSHSKHPPATQKEEQEKETKPETSHIPKPTEEKVAENNVTSSKNENSENQTESKEEDLEKSRESSAVENKHLEKIEPDQSSESTKEEEKLEAESSTSIQDETGKENNR